MSLDRHPTEDLPAYALAALEDSERAAIASHVERCARCTGDLADLEEALYAAAAVGAANVDPPRGLRSRVVLRHRGARVRGGATWTERLRDLVLRPVPLAVPAAMLVVLLIAFAVVGSARQEADAYARALAGVVDGRVVALAPQEGNPDARAVVVIPTQGQPYLIVRLSEPPQGKTWEAWVLKPGPNAVAAGTHDGGGVFTLALTAPLGAGDGVAITLEARPGAKQPTTAPVLAVGKT